MTPMILRSPRTLRLSLLWLGLAGLAPASAAASSDVCLAAALARQPEFSGVVLLRQGGRQLAAAQGQAGGGNLLTIDSRFNLGSASKMFTAVAVVQLAEAGKLELDAPVGRWVEGLAPAVAAVTIRQLLTHSGGLGNFFMPENLAALQQARTVRQQMGLVDDERPAFTPGSRFQYSNTGFLLLGRAVEKASGEDFATYLTRKVFGPAGMAMTSLDPQLPVPAAAGLTRLPAMLPGGGAGLSPPPQGVIMPPPGGPMPPPGAVMHPPPLDPMRVAVEAALPATPAGGAYSTAADIARFFAALRAGKLVGPAWATPLTRPQIDSTPPGAPIKRHYGFGFDAGDWQGHRSFGHDGGAPGVNVEAHSFPDDDVILVVLGNRDPPAASEQYAALRRAALDGTLCAQAARTP